MQSRNQLISNTVAYRVAFIKAFVHTTGLSEIRDQ